MIKFDSRSGYREITPEQGQAMLAATDHSNKNRPVQRSFVVRLLAKMRAGKWANSGEPLLFDMKGNLLDGRHRISALIEYGKPLWFNCLYGDFDWKAIDEGKGRSTADILAPYTDYAIVVGAAVKFVIRHDFALSEELSMLSSPKHDVSNEDALSWWKKHRDVSDDVTWILGLNRSGVGNRLLPPSPLAGAFFCVRRQVNRQEAEAWFTPLITGVGITRNDDPRKILRDLRARLLKRRGGSVSQTLSFGEICKAWNMREQVMSLKRDEDWLKPREDWPFIR